MTRWTATALFFLILSTACAFQRPRPLILNHGLLHASATVAAPGETVEEVFAHVRDLISSELGLGNYEQTPLTMQGVRGSVETWDSNMDANVAWLSSLTMSGEGEGHFFASLQAFVGPKTDVPHFVARCRSLQKTTTESSSPRVALYLDFLPRLDAAYDAPRLEDGSGDYAPPDSREGFAAAGVRRQYAEEFFTADAEAWAAAVTTGADVQPPPCPEPKDCACITATAATAAVPSLPSMFHDSYCSPSSHAFGLSLSVCSSSRPDVEISHHGACTGLIEGPLLLELSLPDTAAGRQACAEAAAAAARRWIGWMATKNAEGNQASASQAGWLTSRMIYARDCQVRNQIYAAAARRFSAFLSTLVVVGVVVVVGGGSAIHGGRRRRSS